eukprot:6581756-Pyramimonas_sp.AAC.1
MGALLILPPSLEGSRSREAPRGLRPRISEGDRQRCLPGRDRGPRSSDIAPILGRLLPQAAKARQRAEDLGGGSTAAPPSSGQGATSTVTPRRWDTRDVEYAAEIKGIVTTVNVTGSGTLVRYLDKQPPGKIIAAQEHRAVGDRLQSLRKEALDVGYRGIWAEALTTEDGGTSGGACVITTSDVM